MLDAVNLTLSVPGSVLLCAIRGCGLSFGETALQLCPGGAGGLVWGQSGPTARRGPESAECLSESVLSTGLGETQMTPSSAAPLPSALLPTWP